MIKREILTSREGLYTKLVRVISSCFAKKDAFQNKGFSSLKYQLKQKKNWHSLFLKSFQAFQPTRNWINNVILSGFSTQNLFQISACVITDYARKAKHLDVTTKFTYSHANTPLSQSERAYYFSYF